MCWPVQESTAEFQSSCAAHHVRSGALGQAHDFQGGEERSGGAAEGEDI